MSALLAPAPPVMEPRPRILHLISSLYVGGAERMLVKVCAATADRFQHSIVAFLPDGALAGDARAAGADVIELGMPRSWKAVMGFGGINRLIHQMNPVLVQGWMYHANLAAVMASPWFGPAPPVLWNVRHTLEKLGEETPLTRATVLASVPLARRARRIIYNAHSGAERHEAVGFPADRRVIIPNGFDLTAYRPDPQAYAWLRASNGLPPDTPIIGRVARNHAMKDNATMIAAFALVAADVSQARLVLVGTGMDRDNDALVRRARSFGIADRILFMGPRTDIPRLTAGFDVALSTSSRNEAFPNVIGEAMACAVPMVATAVGDNATILDGVDRIAPVRDPATLAQLILRLLALTPEERRAIGERDRARVAAHYSIDRIGDTYAALWSEIAERP